MQNISKLQLAKLHEYRDTLSSPLATTNPSPPPSISSVANIADTLQRHRPVAFSSATTAHDALAMSSRLKRPSWTMAVVYSCVDSLVSTHFQCSSYPLRPRLLEGAVALQNSNVTDRLRSVRPRSMTRPGYSLLDECGIAASCFAR